MFVDVSWHTKCSGCLAMASDGSLCPSYLHTILLFFQNNRLITISFNSSCFVMSCCWSCTIWLPGNHWLNSSLVTSGSGLDLSCCHCANLCQLQHFLEVVPHPGCTVPYLEDRALVIVFQCSRKVMNVFCCKVWRYAMWRPCLSISLLWLG